MLKKSFGSSSAYSHSLLTLMLARRTGITLLGESRALARLALLWREGRHGNRDMSPSGAPRSVTCLIKSPVFAFR
jgi:hypothetical protein